MTQIHPPDMLMYLVAIKTFLRHVPARQVWLVADRLTEIHKRLIATHVKGIRIIDCADVDTSGFPKGGTWERLLQIVSLTGHDYVIQLDADTITLATPGEVIDCIEARRSFTLGTSMGRQLVTAREIARQLAHISGGDLHVQVAAERALGDLQPPVDRYIRGNSAFAGFAQHSVSREQLKRFSDAMASALGIRKWSEWGSEQVASNYCVASTRDPLVLPLDRYRYYDPASDLSTAVFLHFIGTHRFAGGVYRRMALEAIADLPRS